MYNDNKVLFYSKQTSSGDETVMERKAKIKPSKVVGFSHNGKLFHFILKLFVYFSFFFFIYNSEFYHLYTKVNGNTDTYSIIL